MLIISHRGYEGPGWENTLDAFQRAVDLGVDGIETDLRLSADGQVVLYHDRLTPAGSKIAQLERGDLDRQVGFPVPGLEEALDVWHDQFWILEIKTPGVLEALIATLRHYRKKHRFLIVSFWHGLIDEIRGRIDVDCGLSLRHRPLDLTALQAVRQKRGGSLETLLWDYEFMDLALVQQAGNQGWQGLIYGPETRPEHQECCGLPIQGIITDHPHILLEMVPQAARSRTRVRLPRN